ncbi:MAG: hypothetical protein QXE68_07125 [Sulfolobales archaeon]
MPDLGVSRLALLPLLLAAVLAAQAYYNPSVPRNDVLWNGAPAPQQALAIYPFVSPIDLICVATGGTLPSTWTFEVLAYQLPTPINQRYIFGVTDWGASPFQITFEASGYTAIRYWDASGNFHQYIFQKVGWKHVLISWDGSTLRYWADGQLVYTARVSNPRTSYPGITAIYGNYSDRRGAPLIVAWVKLWSGAVVSSTQADALARDVAPPGFSLVSGMVYTTWPPRALAGTWDCNGKLFGVPVVRTAGAYLDTAWNEPYRAGRLPAFGFSAAEIAYAHTPTTAVPVWWSITAIYYDGASPWPWIGVGNVGQYGGAVVLMTQDYWYRTPTGAYAGVFTVAGGVLYYNGTPVRSLSQSSIWSPWWWGLRRGAYPSGVSGRAVVQYVWVSNGTGTNMPNDAIMVDYRWWPPVSSVGFFGTWAHPAYQVEAAPVLVPGVATGVVSSNTDTWAGGASTLLPPVPVVAYNGATNNTGLHFGAAYIWRVLGGVSAPVSPIALVPSTYTQIGWKWSGPAPNTGSSLSISFSASGQSATLYGLISAPGTYTFTVGGSASFSIRITQGYDTICTLSGSGSCNVPPGVSLVTISISSTAATTATVRITYSPPSGSVTYAATGRWYGACMPLHHPQVYNGLVTGYYIGDYCSATVSPMQTTVSLPSTSTVSILVDGWIVVGPTSALSSAVQTPSVLYTLNVPSVTNAPIILTAVVNGRLANAYAVSLLGSTLYVATGNVLLTRSPAVLGVSIYTAGGQAHMWYGSIPGDTSTAPRLVTGDLTFVPALSSTNVYVAVNGPVGTAVRLWTVSSGVFYPLGGGVIDGQTPYVSQWSGTWLSATIRFLYAEPDFYTIYVRNSSTWHYAFTTQLAGQSDVIVRFPYPAPYRIEVWRGGTRVQTIESWLDQGSMVYVNTLAGVAQVVALPNRTGGSYVYPLYRISNDPLQPWGYLIYVVTSLSIAMYLYRRVADKGAIAYSAVFDAIVVGVAVYITTASGGQSQYAQLAGLAAVAMLVKIMTAVLPSRI